MPFYRTAFLRERLCHDQTVSVCCAVPERTAFFCVLPILEQQACQKESEKKGVVKMPIPVVNMAATGRKILALRKECGYSVKDLQKVFGFTTPQAIYKWQQGQSMPSIDNFLILSALFEVPINEILVADLIEGPL